MNYTCILKDNEKCLRGVVTMEKPTPVDIFTTKVHKYIKEIKTFEDHLENLPLIPIHPEHLYFFEVGKEYEEGKDFEVKYQLCDANENSASLIEDNWQCVSKMEYDMTKYVKEYKRIAATPLPASPAVDDDIWEESIHNWFELSYAQYLTIPRSVLQSMPKEWQKRFVECLEQLDESIDWRPEEGRYWVKLKNDKGQYVKDPLMDYERGRRKIPLIKK